MDKFIAFYYLIILLLVVFMPNVFYDFGLILIIIQIKIKNHLSLITITPAFSVQYIYNCLQNHSEGFLSFFLSHYYLDGLSSLG